MPRTGFALSIVFHAALAAILLLAAVLWTAPPIEPVKYVIPLVPVKPLEAPLFAKQAGGGGGEASPLPVRQGDLPPAPPPERVFVPPAIARDRDPILPAPMAMPGAPQIEVLAANLGDPAGVARALSAGTGLTGFGTGRDGGVGDGEGPGAGPGKGSGIGGLLVERHLLTRQPEVLVQIEPEYSDEARKARLQGAVILHIVVDANGLPQDIRVVQSVGLGLDEQAIAAVARWRFRPAMVGEMPVATDARIAVGFHLL